MIWHLAAQSSDYLLNWILSKINTNQVRFDESQISQIKQWIIVTEIG